MCAGIEDVEAESMRRCSPIPRGECFIAPKKGDLPSSIPRELEEPPPIPPHLQFPRPASHIRSSAKLLLRAEAREFAGRITSRRGAVARVTVGMYREESSEESARESTWDPG